MSEPTANTLGSSRIGAEAARVLRTARRLFSSGRGGATASRSIDRYRRVALTSGANLLARVTTTASALVSVPLALHYLGAERYGMWLTVSSVVSFVAVADFGLGSGLLGTLAASQDRADRAEQQRLVSTACAAVLALATVVLLLLAPVLILVDWSATFGVQSPIAVAEARPAVAVAALCALLSLVVSLVVSINASFQEGYVNGLWQAAATLVGLGALVLGIRAGMGLTALVLVVAGAPVVGSFLNGLVLFTVRKPWLRPRLGLASAPQARALLSSGLAFTGLAVAYFAIMASPNLVVTHVVDAAVVPEFAVPAKMFFAANLLVALVVTPLWPAYAEALSRHEVAWARRALRWSFVVSVLVGALPCALLATFGGALVHWWVGATVSPSASLLGGLALWTFLIGVGNCTTTFLFAAGVVHAQVVLRVVQLVALVPLQVVLVRRFGVAGAAWALFSTELLLRLLPSLWLVQRVLRAAGSGTLVGFASGAGAERAAVAA